MILSALPPNAQFRLPHSPTVYTIIFHTPGNPNGLTTAWCHSPNVERLVLTGRGTNEHRQDEAEISFSSGIEVEIVETVQKV